MTVCSTDTLPEPNYGLRSSARKSYSDIDTNRVSSEYADWSTSRTSAQAEALSDYAQDSKPYNFPLRTGDHADDAITQGIASIDSSLAEVSTPYDLSTWRVAHVDSIPDLAPGMTWMDEGFTSTSLLEDVADDFDIGKTVKLNILIPQGSHAAYLGGLEANFFSFQQEMLIARGARFRVLRYLERDQVWEVEMIP